jgi:hypothetical protein
VHKQVISYMNMHAQELPLHALRRCGCPDQKQACLPIGVSLYVQCPFSDIAMVSIYMVYLLSIEWYN